MTQPKRLVQLIQTVSLHAESRNKTAQFMGEMLIFRNEVVAVLCSVLRDPYVRGQ
jgi:hypothetical protein